MAIRSTKGFTLIELLVVISIVSLLSSVVVASVSSARQKANVAAGQQFSGSVKRSLYDQAAIFFDFDTMSAINLVSFQQNQGGSNIVTGFTNLGNNISLVTDTDLYRRGKYIYILQAIGNNFSGRFTVTGLDTVMQSQNFTLSVWYKPDLLSNDGYISGWGNGANALHFNLRPINSGGNVSALAINIPSGNSALTNSVSVNLPKGQWVHLAVSMRKPVGNSVADVNVYVNGRSVLLWKPTVFPYTDSSGDTFMVGGQYGGGYQLGYLDDLGVFSTALTAMDVRAIYAAGATEHGLAIK